MRLEYIQTYICTCLCIEFRYDNYISLCEIQLCNYIHVKLLNGVEGTKLLAWITIRCSNV